MCRTCGVWILRGATGRCSQLQSSSRWNAYFKEGAIYNATDSMVVESKNFRWIHESKQTQVFRLPCFSITSFSCVYQMTESSGNAQTRMYSAGVVKIKNQVHINLPVISYHHWINCSFMLFEQPQYRCVSTLWPYIVQVLWYKMQTWRQFHHKDSRVERWMNEIVTEIITNNMALFHGSWCITLKMHMSI